MNLRKFAFIVWAIFSGSIAIAQVNSTRPGWFPFNVSAFDVEPSPIDLSYVDVKPAGKNGFLRAQNGTIVDVLGARVKLFGVNVEYSLKPIDQHSDQSGVLDGNDKQNLQPESWRWQLHSAWLLQLRRGHDWLC